MAKSSFVHTPKIKDIICPICKRLVCDHCFLICDDLDMCVQCATKLNEKGTVVG